MPRGKKGTGLFSRSKPRNPTASTETPPTPPTYPAGPPANSPVGPYGSVIGSHRAGFLRMVDANGKETVYIGPIEVVVIAATAIGFAFGISALVNFVQSISLAV